MTNASWFLAGLLVSLLAEHWITTCHYATKPRAPTIFLQLAHNVSSPTFSQVQALNPRHFHTYSMLYVTLAAMAWFLFGAAPLLILTLSVKAEISHLISFERHKSLFTP